MTVCVDWTFPRVDYKPCSLRGDFVTLSMDTAELIALRVRIRRTNNTIDEINRRLQQTLSGVISDRDLELSALQKQTLDMFRKQHYHLMATYRFQTTNKTWWSECYVDMDDASWKIFMEDEMKEKYDLLNK